MTSIDPTRSFLPQTGGEIKAENLARLRLQEQLAAAGGFALQAPIYALGTPVNAVTRTAHEATFDRLWSSEELERQAGQLLYSTRPFDYIEKGAAF